MTEPASGGDTVAEAVRRRDLLTYFCDCVPRLEAKLLVSRLPAHAGRKFYTCAFQTCGFLLWADKPSSRSGGVFAPSSKQQDPAAAATPTPGPENRRNRNKGFGLPDTTHISPPPTQASKAISPRKVGDQLIQSRIEGWHTSASGTQTRSIASRLCIECTDTLKALLTPLASRRDLPKSVFRSYKRSCNSFILWIDGYSIHTGGLDKPLEASWALRKLTYRLLANVCDLVTEQIVPALDLSDQFSARVSSLRAVSAEAQEVLEEGHREHANGDVSESDSDEESDTASNASSVSTPRSLDEILKDLANDIQCLLDLSPLIEAPIPTPREKGKAVTQKVALITWSPYQAYGDRISRRFPKAHRDLVDRLGKANLVRFQRMQEQKRRAAMAEEAGHKAEGTVNDTASRSKFDDSGLGPSIATRSSYAETVMCYGKDGGHVVRIPRLPEIARAGQPFDCVACGRTLLIRTNKAWKKHLYQDLRPWMCLEPTCGQGGEPFATRESWVQHLAIDHGLEGQWTGFDCSLCGEPTGHGEMAIAQHLASHVEEISLAALPAGADSDDGLGDESDENNDPVVDFQPTPQPVVVDPRDPYAEVGEIENDHNDDEDGKDGSSNSEGLSHKRIRSRGVLEKKFKCPEEGCGKSYSRAEHLYRHQLNHTPKQIYSCDFPGCNRTFVRLDLRNRHRDRHTRGPSLKSRDLDKQDSEFSRFLKPFGVEPESIMSEKQAIEFPQFLKPFGVGPESFMSEKLAQVQSSTEPNQVADDDEGFKERVNIVPSPPVSVETGRALQRSDSLPVGRLPVDELPDASVGRRHVPESPSKEDEEELEGIHRRLIDEAADMPKAYSRPWRCPLPTCKYHNYDWLSEAALNAHMSGMHSAPPVHYHACKFKPCPYKSKRESNVRHHMENAHGWPASTPLSGEECVVPPPEDSGYQSTPGDAGGTNLDLDPGSINSAIHAEIEPLQPAEPLQDALVCPSCHETVETQTELSEHELRHTRPFVCVVPGCSHWFSTIHDLNCHRDSWHSNGMFECTIGFCAGKKSTWSRASIFRSHLTEAHGHENVKTDDLSEYLIGEGFDSALLGI